MEFDEIVERINKAALEKYGRSLVDVERLVLKSAWENKTYAAMTEQAVGYSEHYLKIDVGPNLWRLLTDLVDTPGVRVTKRNIQNVLQTWATEPLEAGEALRLTLTYHKATARYFTEDLGNNICLDMVLIPGGTFLMGSSEDELERTDAEGPQHKVMVPTFFMGRFPTTQAQWRAVAQLDPVDRELDPAPSESKGENHPVERISWYDATEFCIRLSQLTGRDYRLPSEAEWEYACRAGTATPFHFGETITTDLANYRGMDGDSIGWKGNYGQGPKGIYRGETTEVGSFPPNTFGIQDMHGNVWEWCQDHWHDNYCSPETD
ncbi:formylglycine-generating enzyme family protein [Phormidium sp. FACHB-1136]|uniref:formylglycine-generating enzyme family protein n=1 Tax=Phormidium sp. FACHB-1136 TaxID=2692848 RepID=UPI001F54CBAB|nr:formylglycine-generating enzyme family protein [Phormidium sp. FACHB-1136]